ncbi:MAG: 23S rRNA (uracil(1939)-C(5))-methyltransferase RlmD [Bacteroidaceae bacterium]|nr:23S rRNA (uracil(1939)-C(5))-methyltransferase RlmD [Bacteroidaceae bacterium]
MARKKKQLPLLEGIEITDVAAEGKALVRIDDLVVFVPYVVPGDVVDLQITRKKHHYAEAKAVRIVKPSAKRAVPFCEHFGLCGGCKWQCLPYEEQIMWKQRQVMDNLRRIGKVELPECTPILGSRQTQEYRNKLDFGCASKQWLTDEQMKQGIPFHPGIGFHISGAFDKVLPINKCWLMDDLNNQIRNHIFDYACQNGITFYDLRAQHGLLRDIVMRNSHSGEWMVIIQFGPTEPIANNKESIAEEISTQSQFDEPTAMALLEDLHKTFPQISSLLYVYNPKCNDTFGDLDVKTYYGTDFIYELMEDLRFKVGPKSFYQTNTEQAYILYKVAREFAFMNLQDNEATSLQTDKLPLVYDLYTGTGTIANFVAKKARQVIGIEYVPEAIEDAKVNSQINGIDNTLFYAGDMKDILNREFIEKHGRPDVIITDPPRAGMHQDVIDTILFAAPQRIVYVSCNPATQARDIQLLDTAYKVVKIQPVDMFPHTQHVENVVLMVRK